MKKIIVLLVAIFMLTGCFEGIADEVINEDSYKSASKEEAKKFMKLKYNLELSDEDFTGVSFYRHSVYGDVRATLNGYAKVTFRQNGINYRVYVNYENKNMEEYYDDYEKDKIINLFKNYYYSMLNISEENSRIYIPDLIVFEKHMHDKITDLSSFLENANTKIHDFSHYNSKRNDIIIVTTDDINENINSFSLEGTYIDLTVYKLFKDHNIEFKTVDSFINDIDNDNIFKKLFHQNDLYVQEIYNNNGNNHWDINKYKFISLGNNIYYKYSNKDSLKYEINEIDIKEIDKYKEQILENKDGVEIKNVYKIKVKDTSNNLFSNISHVIYNNNIPINTYLYKPKYDVFYIHDDVVDLGYKNWNYFTDYNKKESEIYVVIVENNYSNN